MISLNLPRNPPKVRRQESEASYPFGGGLVPSGITVEEVLAAYRANSTVGNMYLFGSQSDDILFGWSALLRCTDLLSSIVAELITAPGSLRIIGRDRMVRDNPAAAAMVEWLSCAPDGGLTPALTWWGDYASDLCMGNAVAVRESQQRLRRARVASADIVRSEDGNPIYRLEMADDATSARTYDFAPRRVIHARWFQSSAPKSDRDSFFSSAPILPLRQNTDSGLMIDSFIRAHFGPGAWKEGAVLSRSASPGEPASEGTKFTKMVSAWAASQGSKPFAFTGDVTATYASPKLTDYQTVEMRKSQVRDAGRIFGIPGVLLGEDPPSQTVEHLMRLFWRTSAKPFTKKVLDPLSRRLLPRGESFSVDESMFVRGDWDATSKLIASVTQASSQAGVSVVSVNTLRRYLGEPPIPGGDVIMEPTVAPLQDESVDNNPVEEVAPTE